MKTITKRILTSWLLISATLVTVRAYEVSYAYDNAGNRIKREILIDTQAEGETENDGTRSSDKNNGENRFCSETLSGKEIRIYPNPTDGDLSVEITGHEDSDRCTFRIFDMSGRQVVSATADSPVTRVDLTGKPAGMYVLDIVLNGKRSSWKIIKK